MEKAAYRSIYFDTNTIEAMLGAFLGFVSHHKRRRLPRLRMVKAQLTREQTPNDCGPLSIVYAAALLEYDPDTVGQLVYDDSQVPNIKRSHSMILKRRRWCDFMTFRYI